MLILKIKHHLFAIIKKMFYKIIFKEKVKFGKKSTFRKGFNMSIEGIGKVEIGERCFFNNYCSINSLNKISIGNDTIFGENVKLYDHNHKFSDKIKLISQQGYNTAPISIGKNCWIGSGVIILKGVCIGDNVVIGAGCIINSNIQSNTIVRCKNNIIIEDKRM
ncbi:acyltransferase [Clostridium sp. D43t1_170807_H7]|uniref:acyltransferase n=1 Tax=Clostridium sp. D43t1_170807_H7 TaxID=2787140 RepID=UPI001899FEAD|nr:acyltransferase [Clostridium sp. D43t1_170807_H7]